MAEFTKLVITTSGQQLIAKMIAGNEKICFTKVAASSTKYSPEQLEDLTELTNIEQEVLISNVERTNDVAVKIEVILNNTELITGYSMQTLGLYATDTDGAEILYAVTVESSNGCFLPAYNGVTVSGAHIQLITTVGNAVNVSLVVDPAAVATKGEVEELKKSVSDGKKTVAAAITAKGQATEEDAAFAVMAANIGKIETGVDTSDATARESDIIGCKSAYVNGEKIYGSLLRDYECLFRVEYIQRTPLNEGEVPFYGLAKRYEPFTGKYYKVSYDTSAYVDSFGFFYILGNEHGTYNSVSYYVHNRKILLCYILKKDTWKVYRDGGIDEELTLLPHFGYTVEDNKKFYVFENINLFGQNSKLTYKFGIHLSVNYIHYCMFSESALTDAQISAFDNEPMIFQFTEPGKVYFELMLISQLTENSY